MLNIGIDIAKNKHDCAVLSETGEVLKTFRFANSKLGFKQFISEIPAEEARVAIEATGIYGDNLENFLHSYGFSVIKLNPLMTNIYRKSLSLRKTKTDKVDCVALAKMLISCDYAPVSPTDKLFVELKTYTRQRKRLVKQCSTLKSQISRLLTMSFPEFESVVSNIHGKTAYAIFLEFPTVSAISSAHLIRLRNVLTNHVRGRSLSISAVNLRELARNSIGVVNSAVAFELQQNIRLVQFYQTEIATLEAKISEILSQINSPISTITGIGDTLAAIIISEFGDIKRFANPSKMLAFAGLEPSQYQSGKFTATNTPMVKRGSPYLRWALLYASRHIANKDPVFSLYLSNKLAEGKHYNVAMSHVAKKLVRVIFHLVKTGKEFSTQSA